LIEKGRTEMKNMSRRLLCAPLIILLCFLASCGQPEVNENVQRLAEVLMNAPNEDIPLEELGEGVQPSEAQGGEDKLRELLGGCIAEGYYDAFFGNSPDAMLILGNAQVYDITVSLESLTLKEETDDGQTVTVKLKVNGETDVTADVTFQLDEDGLLKSMKYEDAGGLAEALAAAAK